MLGMGCNFVVNVGRGVLKDFFSTSILVFCRSCFTLPHRIFLFMLSFFQAVLSPKQCYYWLIGIRCTEGAEILDSLASASVLIRYCIFDIMVRVFSVWLSLPSMAAKLCQLPMGRSWAREHFLPLPSGHQSLVCSSATSSNSAGFSTSQWKRVLSPFPQCISLCLSLITQHEDCV